MYKNCKWSRVSIQLFFRVYYYSWWHYSALKQNIFDVQCKYTLFFFGMWLFHDLKASYIKCILKKMTKCIVQFIILNGLTCRRCLYGMTANSCCMCIVYLYVLGGRPMYGGDREQGAEGRVHMCHSSLVEECKIRIGSAY